MQKWIASIILLFSTTAFTYAQDSYQDKVQAYIEQYKTLAISEQIRTGVPAAIKLGQGILETQAGCSRLVAGANNHFGIKCKKAWTGETFSHTDDAPNECFRKYGCADDSYKDHSDYLHTGTRYAALFNLSPTDYASWAVGLRKCGYATNPRYAHQLIKIIEDFQLQQYTYAAMGGIDGIKYASATPSRVVSATATAQPAASVIDTPRIEKVTPAAIAGKSPSDNKQHNQIEKVNGLKAVYAYKGEMLLPIAMKHGIHYAHLLEMNDLPDAPLYADMYIYLEKKHAKGPHATHTFQDGESLHSVSQAKGIQLKKLLAYNRLLANDVPVTGSVLQLQQMTMVAPTLVTQLESGEAERTSGIKVKYIGDFNTEAAAKIAAETAQAAKQAETSKNTAPESAPQTIITNAAIAEPAADVTSEPVREEPAKDVPPATKQQTQSMTPAGKTNDLDALKAMLDKAVYTDNQPTQATTQVSASLTDATNKHDASKYYVVKKGDTAFSIAKRNNLTMRQLMDMNDLNFDQIKIGQRLRVQ